MNAMCEHLAESRAVAANEALARVRALEQLRHADRLATAGKLAAGVAHELGTPLNVVSARARLIREEALEPEEIRDYARVIGAQSERMTSIIRQLLDFARVQPGSTERGDLSAVALEATSLLGPTAEKKGVRLTCTPPSARAFAMFSWSHMLQAVMNLVVNAVHAAPKHSVVTLTTGITKQGPPPGHAQTPEHWAVLSVSDHGPGISPEVVARIFEPFFTTKAVGEGTGLGLSVAYGIAAEHGGFIGVETELTQGSTFSIYLPLAAAELASAPPAPEAPARERSDAEREEHPMLRPG